MTPRRRVEAILRGEPADKVPFTIYESMLPQCTVERRLRNQGLCIVNRRYPVVRTRTPRVTRETRPVTRDGVACTRTEIRTPVGELSCVCQPAGFTSWQVEKLFKSPEDYRPLLFWVQDTEYEPCYEEFAKAEAELGEDVILRPSLGLTPLHQIMIAWMGVETFAVEWHQRRDEVLKLYEALAAKRRELYPLVAKSPAMHANYGGNETGEVMGRERFEKYVLPNYQEAAEVFHRHGTLLGAHLDGNNRVWADVIARSALDYVEAFTPAPDCDMTLREALEAWPGKVLWINFTSSVHLQPDEAVESHTRQLLQEAAPGDRLLVGITEDIPAHRWQRSLQAISRGIEKYGRLPIVC